MTKFVSAARVAARTWLSQYWPRRDKAREVCRQYRAMFESCPLAVADLLTFGCAFDSTIGETPEETVLNTGMRETALHLITMAQLTPDDLRHLQGRTEEDG